MGLNASLRRIVSKIEATYAQTSGLTFAPTDAVRVFRESLPQPYVSSPLPLNTITSDIGASGNAAGSATGTGTYTVYAVGSGTNIAPVDYGVLLRACALSQTIGASSVTYTPVSTAFESAQILDNINGLQYRLRGLRSNATFDFTAGALPSIAFATQFVAAEAADQTETALTSGTYQTTRPVVVSKQNTVATIDGYAACIRKLTYSTGNEISDFNVINCAGNNVKSRAVTGSIEFEMTVPTGAKNWLAMLRDGVQVPFSMTHGLTAGNIVKVDAPKLGFSSLNFDIDQASGFLYVTAAFDFNKNVGNDEFVYTTQ